MARSEPTRRSARRIALGTILALGLPALIACNSLIGLSDFEKGQCSGARCPDEGGLFDQFVEGGADVSQDAFPDVKGADPVSWAKWRMPNYGEGGAGQPPPSQPLNNDAGVGLVSDPTTKLVWSSTLVPGDFVANQAASECQKLPNGPWRAPKRIELVSLLDYSRPKPFVDQARFPGLSIFKVWTTSEVRPFIVDKPDQAYWVVNFETGAVEPLPGNLQAKVLCVRAK